MILGKLSALCTLAVVLLSHSDVGEGIVFREEFASAVVDQMCVHLKHASFFFL